jgi:hypothetical protein
VIAGLPLLLAVLLGGVIWQLWRLEKSQSAQLKQQVSHSLWLRRQSIDEVMISYRQSQIDFPNASKMVESGEIHHRPGTRYEFKEGDSISDVFDGVFGGGPLDPVSEAAINEWRNLALSQIAQISKIFWSSRYLGIFEGELNNAAVRDLKHYADQSIATIVGSGWRSLDRFTKHYFPPELEGSLVEHVNDLFKQQKKFAADLRQSELESVDQAHA